MSTNQWRLGLHGPAQQAIIGVDDTATSLRLLWAASQLVWGGLLIVWKA